MNIVTNQLSLLLAPQVAVKTATSLMLGELISATVLKRNSTNTITIQIKDKIIDAKMQNDIPVKTGDKLQLRVESLHTPLQLKLIRPISDNPKQIQEQLFRENLPKQTKLNQFISTIKPPYSESTERLPIIVKKQLKQMLEQFPKPQQLQTASALKQAILNSGLFFEAKVFQQIKSLTQKPIQKFIAEQTQIVNNNNHSSTNSKLDAKHFLEKDLKAELLNLNKLVQQQTKTDVSQTKSIKPENKLAPIIKHFPAIKNTTQQSTKLTSQVNTQATNPTQIMDVETLTKHVEAAIARIETNQARAINTELNPSHHFFVELPIKDKDELDMLTLDINEESSKELSDADSNWTVKVKIEFGDKGHLYANVSLYNGDIQLSVWSENETIDHLIDSQLGKLNTSLERQGLSVKRCQHINQTPSRSEAPIQSSNLISISL